MKETRDANEAPIIHVDDVYGPSYVDQSEDETPTIITNKANAEQNIQNSPDNKSRGYTQS